MTNHSVQISEAKFGHSVAVPIRVMLVDGHQIVLWGLEKLIDAEKPTMEVVGKADNCVDARRLVRETQPDILLFDPNTDAGQDPDIVSHLVQGGHTRVVIFTGGRDMGAVDHAVLHGARGLVRKEDSNRTLLNAIRKVHAGELWLDHETTGRIFSEFSRTGGNASVDLAAAMIDGLTRKEYAVLCTFANFPCSANKKIAEKLFISEHTLRNHLTSIFAKLQITNRCGLCEFVRIHRSKLGSDLRGYLPVSPPLE